MAIYVNIGNYGTYTDYVNIGEYDRYDGIVILIYYDSALEYVKIAWE
jgi:hypothetical protein